MCNHHHHHHLSSRVGHRPQTKALQAARSRVSLSNCPQLWPLFLMSASISLLQVILGRPLFLLPCGFHVRDCLVVLDAVFLRVWPIHLHLRWRISSSTGSCWMRRQSSSLVMTFGQRILSIFRRHELINVCSFFEPAAVVRQVSAPYLKTGFTVVLNILTLVFRVRLQLLPCQFSLLCQHQSRLVCR